MAEPAGWRLSDLLWERLSEAALAAFDAGRSDDAGALWVAALALAERFRADDPRRAASLNNLAAVRHRRGGAAEADELYRAALAAWKAAEAWVGSMRTAPRAKSSLFHLRLEQKHRADYQRLAHEAQRKLLHEGRAASLVNLATLRRAAGGDAEADALAAAAMDLAPRGANPGIARWTALAPAGFTDERKLAAAVVLVAVAGG